MVICVPAVPEDDDKLAMVGGGLRVIVAEPLFVVSAALVAVTVTVCWVATVEGAVYRPELSMVPVFGLTLQVTAVLLVFETIAAKCCGCDGARDTVDGVTLTVTVGFKVTVADALLVLSAALVAVTVTVCWLATELGAV